MSRDTLVHHGQLDVQGCRLAYSRTGDGPPVVLIQGVGVHGAAWQPQLDALAAHFTCLWFDNRGIGASGSSPGPLTVTQLAADVVALIESQGWTSAHLVGHSLGGLIAQRVALSEPRRVRSLALLCTFACGRHAGASGRMAWIGLRSRVGTRAMRRAAFLEILAPAAVRRQRDLQQMAAELEPLFGHDLADHPAIEMRQLRAMRAEDTTGELARLRGVPTLVMSATHDPIAPPALGRRLAEAIAGARYEELTDQAHGAPILAAATVNALLREHLQQAEPGVSSGSSAR